MIEPYQRQLFPSPVLIVSSVQIPNILPSQLMSPTETLCMTECS